MQHARAILVAAAMLAGPATAGAQVTNHVSWQMGLAAGGHPSWTAPGIGLAYQPVGLGRGISFGLGLGVSFGLGIGVYDDYWGGYRHGFLGRSHCWDSYLYDPFLYDPFFDCWGLGPFGYSPFGWDGWYSPWWRPYGFLGWPSHRYVAQHYYAWAPGWSYGWAPTWSYGWAPGWSRYTYGLYGGRYWGFGDWYRDWAYQPRRHYASRGYGGRSPLFGPRFKEPPVYVTDNGPERPVATLRPRGPNGALGDIDSRRGGSRIGDGAAQLRGTGVRTARPRNQPGARTATPRPSTRGTPSATRRPSPIRSTPPKVTRRPEGITSRRPTPTRRPTPQTRSGPSRRPQPAARTPTPRRMPTTVRTSPPKRQPAVRTAPRRPAIKSTAPRRSPPKVRSSAPRRSPPKARPAPRRAPPKARPAPRRSPPKARPAPKRPPKAPVKRSAPPRRRGG